MSFVRRVSVDSVDSLEEAINSLTSVSISSSTINNDGDRDHYCEVKVVAEPPPLSSKHFMDSSLDVQVEESSFAPKVFREHLKLMKTEDKAREKLYNDIEIRTTSSNLPDHGTLDGVTDKGSKTNLFQMHAPEEEHIISEIPTTFDQLDLTNRMNLDELISRPKVEHKGRVLLGLNATLPVLCHQNQNDDGRGHYVVTTVIEGSENSQKAVRLEISCRMKGAEALFHKMKHPYLNNLEPGSLIAVKNPHLTDSILIKDRKPSHLSLHANIEDVHFVAPLLDPSKLTWKDSCLVTNRKASEANEVKSKTSLSSSCEAKLASEEWRLWGNQFTCGRFHSKALFAYDVAIRFDPENLELASARSAAMINLGLFSGALADVEMIANEDPFNTGYILRKMSVFTGLGLYHSSLDYLNTLLDKLDKMANTPTTDTPDHVELRKRGMFIHNIIVKTEKILQQQMNPDELGSERYFKGALMKNLNDDPEYYKPLNIEDVSSVDGQKRSIVVANQLVKAGKLLAITKAFAVTNLDGAGSVYTNENEDLINTMIQKFVVDKPSEDTFYKRDVKTHVHAPTSPKIPMKVTKELVKELYRKHFYIGNVTVDPKTPITPEGGSISSQFPKSIGGIWTFPAKIRHACVGGNAIWYTVGNLMFIRAIRDVVHGEEVVMAHVDSSKSYEARHEFLAEKGLRCFCPICQFERSEPEQIKNKRALLLQEFRLLNRFTTSDWTREFTQHEVRKLQFCIEDLLVLRSAYAKLNFPIIAPLCQFGIYLMSVNKYDEAIGNFERAFFVVDNTAAIFTLLNISLHLSYCYMVKKARDKAKAKKWFGSVKSYAALSFGCLEPVKANFRKEFDYLEKKGIASLKM